jgi:hypothetical protein
MALSMGGSGPGLPSGALVGTDGAVYGGNLQVVTTFGGFHSDTNAFGSVANAHSTTMATAMNFGSSMFGLSTNLLG